MKHVIVTVGPQYAGKSTFCQRVVSVYPDIVLVSRDAILIELFGTVWLNDYTGGHLIGWEKVWEVVARYLTQERVTMILDAWNDTACERREIVKKLQLSGATRVNAWYFVTPEDVCLKWYLERESPHCNAKTEELRQLLLQMCIEEYRNHYRAFHKQPVENERVFDIIRRINPLEILPSLDLPLF